MEMSKRAVIDILMGLNCPQGGMLKRMVKACNRGHYSPSHTDTHLFSTLTEEEKLVVLLLISYALENSNNLHEVQNLVNGLKGR